jgi:hypothetical protein
MPITTRDQFSEIPKYIIFYDDYAPILDKATCQQLARKNSDRPDTGATVRMATSCTASLPP